MIQLPTVSEEGIEISLCKDCGYQRTRSVERLPEETTTETVTETTTSESTIETVTEISSATETIQTTVERTEIATSAESFTETTTDISVNDNTEMTVWIVCIVLISIGGIAVVIYLCRKKFH